MRVEDARVTWARRPPRPEPQSCLEQSRRRLSRGT